MKKFLCMISLTTLLVISNYHPCLAQQTTGPRMTLEERLFDAKQVSENTFIEHSFKVLNTGDSPLEISGVSTG
ncbi:MAG TPA: hypothetical protein VJ373_07580 [Desulfatiglandales bacterium]|nr:hypothetical protein [Desulfatiglandales bacterium]